MSAGSNQGNVTIPDRRLGAATVSTIVMTQAAVVVVVLAVGRWRTRSVRVA